MKARDVILIVVVILAGFTTTYYAVSQSDIIAEANVLKATLAEMQQSRHPESHPYFWFCPSEGECAEDGYLVWYSAHGGS